MFKSPKVSVDDTVTSFCSGHEVDHRAGVLSIVYQKQSAIQRHRTSTRYVLDGGSTLDLKGPSTPAVPIHASGKDDVCNYLQSACLVLSLGRVVALTGRIEGGWSSSAAVVKVQGELSCAGSVHSIS